MTGINKAPIVNGLETIFSRLLVEPSPKALGRGEIIGVIVQNPLVNADGTNNNSEIWAGSGSNMIYFMLPGQESPVFYAEDLKDIYLKLKFPVVNPNGGILTAAILNPPTGGGAGYQVGDVLTLPSTFGTDAEITVTDVDDGVATVALGDSSTRGTGYAMGDVLTLVGGNGAATVTVDEVDGSGSIQAVHLTNPGNGYLGGVVATTGGSGDGTATIIITVLGTILTFNVTTPGTGFAVEQVIDAEDGSGTGAQIIVLTVETVLAESADVTLIIYRLRNGGKQ